MNKQQFGSFIAGSRKDAGLTQQELADRAGITRSSVAVHISNLMKKGYITGKGYIVQPAPYVTVVGGVNVDVGGRPEAALEKTSIRKW